MHDTYFLAAPCRSSAVIHLIDLAQVLDRMPILNVYVEGKVSHKTKQNILKTEDGIWFQIKVWSLFKEKYLS